MELTVAFCRTEVGEPEKIEGLGLITTTRALLSGETTKLDCKRRFNYTLETVFLAY